MKFFKQLLDRSYHFLKDEDWDNFTVTDGDVGKGKSNLWLHGLEYWQTLINGECKEEDIKHISLDKNEFVNDLRELKRYGMTVYDEAGDLSNLRTMNNFNYTVSLTYTVVRGLNLFSNLNLPNIFRLNSYFVRDRARFYIRVYERGKIAVWDRPRIKKIIDLNQNRILKSPWVVKPLFFDTFPKYTGVLLSAYKEKKENRLNSIREELLNLTVEEELKTRETDIIKRLKEAVGTEKAAEIWGVHANTIRNKLKAKNIK
jgi:hypothetical protein